jgi:hypothetical protein
MKPNKPLSNPFGIQETFDYVQQPMDDPFAFVAMNKQNSLD